MSGELPWPWLAAEVRSGASQEAAEPHEMSASPCSCPAADTAAGSASWLAVALAACRDLLVASGMRVLRSPSPSLQLCSSCRTCSAPICLLLASSFCLLPSVFFSVVFSPCASLLVFLSHIFSAPFFQLLFPSLRLLLLFRPALPSPWHTALLYGKFLESVRSRMLRTASHATGQHKLCIAQITVLPNLY